MAIELRETLLTSFLMLFLSFMLFLIPLSTQPVRAAPKLLTVDDDGGADFTRIQDAINAASPGDTIYVYNGTYRENVVVNKTLSLVGENRDSTIIDGSRTRNVIYLLSVSNVSIHGFTVMNSGTSAFDSGIFIERSSGSEISYNRIISNYDGIVLLSSSNNIVSSNVIYSNSNDAIGLYLSSNNIVSSNVIYSNTFYGIDLSFYSINNAIYHNNFNNTLRAWSVGLKNFWDHDGEGNYWSDYKGQDLNEDGIGDTSYTIDVTNRDNYPLVGFFSDFSVTLKGKTYHVTVISNSAVSAFGFEVGAETGNRIIRYNVAGKDNTVGFSRVRIPTALMKDSYVVIVGEEIVPKILGVSNETCAILYFTYNHSGQIVTIFTSKALQQYNELLAEHNELQATLNDLNATYQAHLLEDYENVRNIRNLTYIIAATTAVFILTTVYLAGSSNTSSSRLTASSIDGRRRT